MKRYYAVDHSKLYLDNACTFLKKNTSNVDIIGIEADLMSLANLKSLHQDDCRKCILFLGGTIGNFSFTLQVQALRQIFQLMNIEDKFILVVDTNQDEKTLLKSYDNVYLYELVKGVLKYFTQINPEFENYIDFFKVCCVWNKNLNLIDIYFQATQDMSFEMTNYGKIFISKGQECRGIVSRKTPLKIIKELLSKIGFNILDILNDNSNLQLIICQKPQK
ncbi:hypothetical protein NOVO_00985 [Rickettsiales bacterium Ac37b]|nr:hypothetical protein NOVO_00985 [Rickettsiales bacterium Ac37b]